MTEQEIASINYQMGVDQQCLESYLVNAIDTAREKGLSAEKTALYFICYLQDAARKGVY